MTSVQQQVIDLQQQIQHLEYDIGVLDAEIAEIREEMCDFEARYDALIRPLTNHLSAVQAAIQSLEQLRFLQKRYDEAPALESLWRSPATTPPPAQEAEIPPEPTPSAKKPRANKNSKLKKLYRNLARRYHPDMAKTELERQQYTKIMALINTAYTASDYESLLSLSDATHDDSQQPGEDNSDVPLAVLQLRPLQQQVYDLQAQLRDLQIDRNDLLHGEMMKLKVQASFAKAEGRDFLQELADEMDADYHQEMIRLDALRRDLDTNNML